MIKAIDISIEPAGVEAEEGIFLGVDFYRFSMTVDDKKYGYVLNQGKHLVDSMGEEFAFRLFMEQVTNKVVEVAFGADN